MDFHDVVRRRRMVRSFTDAPVAAESVERILDAGRRGPSAGHSQGIEFVIVTDPATRATIAGGFQRVVDISGHHNFVAQARVHIVICANAEIYRARYREADKMQARGAIDDDALWTVPYWWSDAGCAQMLMLLAAVDEGLAAAFVGYGPGEHAVKTLLGIPDDYRILGAVLVGHEADDARQFGDVSAVPRRRRAAADVVHRDHW